MESLKRNLSEEEGSKKRKKIDIEPPTADEINQLRETENLFHSNLFRMQIEDILSKTRVSERVKMCFNETWFPKFEKMMKESLETEEVKKPSKISIIGSYANDTIMNSDTVIDIAIEMPASTFQKGDFKNYRFFKKQRTYLNFIASNIKDDIVENKSFMGNNENVVLKLIPCGKLGKKCSIYIHIAAQENSFNLHRFLPDKNSVRPGWFFENESSEEESLIPTPHYNSAVLHSLTMLKANEQSIQLIKEYPNIRDGIILLKIWLAQRELIKGYNAFNGHIMTMYVLYLLRTKKLNTFMSSYQIVRNVWNNLAQSNWSESGISLCQEEKSLQRISDYQKYYSCVFLDTTGYHNITANISKEMISWVQSLAAASVALLDDGQSDSFQILFMRKIPLYRTFDNVICIHDTEILKNIVQKFSTKEDKLNFGPNTYLQCVKLIVNILKEGLGKRLLDIFVMPEQFKEWSITEDVPEYLEKIFIGLNFNPEHFFDIITKGPEGNSPKAADFRKFWGNKSELHRFNDGSINEVVVWGQGKSLEEKRSISKKIILFLLQKKFGLHRSKLFYLGNQLENILKLQKSIKTLGFEYGTGEEASLRVIEAFNSLEKQLTSLTDMPLSITGIRGCSAVLRYTEVFPPLKADLRNQKNVTVKGETYLLLEDENLKNAPFYVPPIEVNIQLLTSGKWPDDLEAIKFTKGAFYVQIAECLRKQCKLKAQGCLQYTDVFIDGFMFRLRIAQQKEISLIKQQTGEDGITKYKNTEKSLALEKKLFHLPKINGALHGLHCQQPSFGPACCLAKRWLSSQLIDDSHFPDIVVELLLASIYLKPDPYKPTQMPQVAFFRLLELFSRSYWSSDPIIVNFNNEMSRDQIVAIENTFRSSRETLPFLFISTPYDHQNSIWTKTSPNTLILNRVKLLAIEALKLIEDFSLNCTLNYKVLFRPPLFEYDCLIHLKPDYTPRRHEAIEMDENIVEYQPSKNNKKLLPVVDFDPVQQYLKELRLKYNDYALFFHDTYGGKVIGVLLKPSALEPKEEVHVKNIYFRKLNSKGNLELGLSTMIENLYFIGKNIIAGIDIQSKKISMN